MTGSRPDLPDASARALYAEILDRGGRLASSETAGVDGAALARLVALGLLVDRPECAAHVVVDPRAVGSRVSAGLRSEATRLFVQAEELPREFAELSRAYDAAPRRIDRSSKVQQVHGTDAIQHRLDQVEADCTWEILVTQPGTTRPAQCIPDFLPRIRRFCGTGGAVRIIYSPGTRADATAEGYGAEATAQGAGVRFLSEPFRRMHVYDRRVVVIPAGANGSAAAFIEDPAVVGFLVARFERDWERAERVPWDGPDPRNGTHSVQAAIAQLLSQGLTQRSIAGRLGLGERTVAGHISRLREEHDAETLFRLGWQMREARDGTGE
ncbi:LuxR family transcriptional regulator [Kitasatospora sp. NPDC057223]|uniref:LuxR family transcriptional regulator n=1 Tax=Kitasatospora sp. NPDC057223 TaxID=3346055 RepID=UPI00362ED015